MIFKSWAYEIIAHSSKCVVLNCKKWVGLIPVTSVLQKDHKYASTNPDNVPRVVSDIVMSSLEKKPIKKS